MLGEDGQKETGEGEERDETRPQGPRGPIGVSVQLQYQLGERTETHLQKIGARCVEESTLTDLYYDTESFQLAARQTWLSKQGDQWKLIVDQRPHFSDLTRGQDKHTGPKAETGIGASQAEMCPGIEGIVGGGESVMVPESFGDDPFPALTGGAECVKEEEITLQSPPSLPPQYCELTAASTIVEHLAQCLHVAPTEEEGGETMSVDRFVELFSIQNYGSWTVSRQLEYTLPGTCTLEVRKDYISSPRAHTALLTMGVNVLDISRELERMEGLAAELDLQHRPA